MVKGLDKFREYFKGFDENYTIIGGTACDCLFTEEGFNPRATKDIDLLIILEKYNPEFNKRLWEFIEAGGYKTREREEKEQRFYRFLKPEKEDYPAQLEILCRNPEIIQVPPNRKITALDPSEEFLHLSVIMIDEESYRFILANSIIIGEIPIANIDALIYLKAVAFLNLTNEKLNGREIKSDDIKKHKYDVFRLAALLRDGTVTLSGKMADKMKEFITVMETEKPDVSQIYKSLGADKLSLTDAMSAIKKRFGLYE